jgi:hypothetical protein
VALDEVAAPAVAVEQGLVDGDRLHHRASARAHRAVQTREVTGPVRLADRFEHLDRNGMIVDRLDVTVVEVVVT